MYEEDDTWTDRSSITNHIDFNDVDMGNMDGDDFPDEPTKIKIDENLYYGCNLCFICEKEYRHSKTIIEYSNGLQSININTSHKKCEDTCKKYILLKEKMLAAEWKYYYLKSTKYYYLGWSL